MSPSSTPPPDCISLVSSTSNTDNSSLFATTKPVVLEQQRRYVHSGIGGVGNYHRVESRSQAIRFIKISLSRCKKTFSTGIGGAGNRHDSSQAAMLSSSSDDKVARRTKASQYQERHASGVYHYGIGGTGNQAIKNKKNRSSSSFAAAEAVSPLETAAAASSSTAAVSPPPAPRPETEKVVQYSDQPLPVGAADRLAAKLFGIRKQTRSPVPKVMSTGQSAVVREDIPMRERPYTAGAQRRELVNG
ncbi:MAG: hypothetical protein M1816_000299 [Peltula sp. TS41687]|nr:MAG: hypothetical protein M1816_000299 [Peltula sp. TS41687]